MEWLVDLFNRCISFIYSLFLSLPQIFKDIFWYGIEQSIVMMKWALSFILLLLEPMDVSQYLTAIPPNVAWVFIQIGLPNCLAIIGSAIVIRMTLQLIPFTRLGS